MEQGNLLWYKRPAAEWNEALPVGNGRIGAMIYGIPEHEIMQLNEDSLWYGGPMNRINPDARKNLEKVRGLILNGKISEAEDLLKLAFSGTPRSMRPYQPLGKLHIDMRNDGVSRTANYMRDRYRNDNKDEKDQNREPEITDYKMCLYMDKAMHEVRYTQGGVTFTRETVASYPDQIIAVKIKADKLGKVSFACSIERERFYETSEKIDNNTVAMRGSCGEGGVRFEGAVRAVTDGGTAEVVGESIVVEGADEAVLYIAAETSFYNGDRFEKKIAESLDSACNKGFRAICTDHLADYRSLYERVSLKLTDSKNMNRFPTDVRLSEINMANTDNDLIVTYFNFGRYLLISSSRPGTLPANLQGIWNDDMNPKWDSKFTININTEMNYWPAEMCGLSECHMPLFDMLRRMQQRGTEVAWKMYGCRGFVAHHNTDIWADCAPQDIWLPATYWTLGGAWLCIHIWQHYVYSEDMNWLKSVYDIMRDAVLFFEDFLIEDNGELVTCPSCSPENTYILHDGSQGRVCSGPTMDNQILRELFSDFIKASELLGVNDNIVKKAETVQERLPKTRIGKYGQIMEWREDYDEIEPGHRHISQLYGLYPGHEITMDRTPELAAAADATLKRRLKYGGGHTGWSCAWIIGFYASLWQGNKAYENLVKLLKNSTNINLMDNHPLNPSGKIFQIDGNLGAAADIVQMLVQADEERIILLPALPDRWQEGSLKGVCLPGRKTISVFWKSGSLVQAEIMPEKNEHTIVIYGGIKKKVSLKAGILTSVEFS